MLAQKAKRKEEAAARKAAQKEQEAVAIDSESSSEDIDTLFKRQPRNDALYVPATFETMMESFGVNLQRKTLQDRFQKCYREAEGKFKQKEVTLTEILNQIAEAGDSMKKLVKISGTESAGLKNSHN